MREQVSPCIQLLRMRACSTYLSWSVRIVSLIEFRLSARARYVRHASLAKPFFLGSKVSGDRVSRNIPEILAGTCSVVIGFFVIVQAYIQHQTEVYLDVAKGSCLALVILDYLYITCVG